MLTVNIKATNIELTDAIKDYAERKLNSLDKFMHSEAESMHVEIGKISNHHKQGEVYKAEVNLSMGGKKFYAIAEKEDLYTAIDEVREDIVRQLTENKERSVTLFRRGARSVKKMMKGISKRNPFTSKY